MPAARTIPGYFRTGGSDVHGGGRRPSRRDAEFAPDEAELEAWNRRQQVAINLNRWRPKREEAADLKLRREEAAGES